MIKRWVCNDCKNLEDGGVECCVETGWDEKPSACPMDKTENCHWNLRPNKPCETCRCMDCGEIIKVSDQSTHLKDCSRPDCKAEFHVKEGEYERTTDLHPLE